MKKKFKGFAVVGALALMMSATVPYADVVGVSNSLTASASALNSYNNLLSHNTGDTGIPKITLSPYDFDKNWGTKSQSGVAVSDKFTVYKTTLDENGNSSVVVHYDADDFGEGVSAPSVETEWDSKEGYVAVVERGAVGLIGGMVSYFYLDDNAEWELFYKTPNGKGQDFTNPPLSFYFCDKTLGDVADIIPDGSPISIYKEDEDGNKTLVKKVKKLSKNESPDAEDVLFVEPLEYDKYSWVAEVDYTGVCERVTTKLSGTVTGAWLASKPYVTKKNLSSVAGGVGSEVAKPSDTSNKLLLYNLQFPVLSEGRKMYDESGNFVLQSISDTEHGDAQIIRDNKVIKTISAGDIDYGIPTIAEDTSSDAQYFIRIGTDKNNTGYVYYTYNKDTGWWDYDLNTEDLDPTPVRLSLKNFPKEYAGGVVYKIPKEEGRDDIVNTINTEWCNDSTKVSEFTKQDFAKSSKFTVIETSGDYSTTVFFDYGADGGIYYQFVGSTPVPMFAYGKRAEGVLANTVEISSDTGMDTGVEIMGVDEDGNEVYYFTVPYLYLDPIILLSDGEYTVVNTDTGIKNEISDGKFKYANSDEESVMNLTEPVTVNEYVIKDVNGAVTNEGSLTNTSSEPKTISNLVADTDIPSKQVEWMSNQSYYEFEVKSGVVNSVREDCLRDKGYLVFDNSENAQTGDVNRVYTTGVEGDINQDRKFNIADLVSEQKYLLNADDAFGAENYISSDVCTDGRADVFDMITLRQMLIEQMSNK